MNKQEGVVLKPGKEKALFQRHHWVFSGAVQSLPSFIDGAILPVFSSTGKLLGSGYFNRQSNILGRMLNFDATPPLESLETLLARAVKFRRSLFNLEKTNAYRLVNGEGDGIAGLILDIYDKVIVLQSSTKGIECLKQQIVDWLKKHLNPEAIYEKSLLPSRCEEGLSNIQGMLSGSTKDEIIFKENGLLFTASLEKSQKTGFFLDHREMRLWVQELVRGKRVLNAFSYTGGFTLYALAGGAARVDSLDISKEAIAACRQHVLLNGWDPDNHGFITDDVFKFLREQALSYDFVILDPPAFAKKKKDVIQACRGYKDINRLAMQKMPSGSLLLTSSCSHHVDENLFQKVLFQAALEAKREVQIIGRHRLAPDHPINLYHPESDYLKSFLLYLS